MAHPDLPAEQGLRELYVALTRPTKSLVLVHSRPLPAELRASLPGHLD